MDFRCPKYEELPSQGEDSLMGLYDGVRIKCPVCGETVEFQSKAGDCDMTIYSLEDAPDSILFDIMNDPLYHMACKHWITLIDRRYPPGYAPPRPALSAANTRPPKNPGIHPGGYRWWPEGQPFTYEDLEQ